MDFMKYLEDTSKKLDKEVQRILNQWLKEVKKIDSKLIPLAKAFTAANFGGKRIRGVLVNMGYEIASSKTPRNDVIRVGAAYEIFHTSILAHDDIMDESPTRRGRKSLYKSVGVSQAITLADLGFFLAIKIISESKFDDKEKNEALKWFSKTMVYTAIGQMLDIAHADPRIVATLKTARYTISGPLQIGVILGGADKKLIRVLGEFGENLGIAFQIRDDILDKEALVTDGQVGVQYVMDAKKYIPKITSDKLKRKLLEDMAEYLVQRNK